MSWLIRHIETKQLVYNQYKKDKPIFTNTAIFAAKYNGWGEANMQKLSDKYEIIEEECL